MSDRAAGVLLICLLLAGCGDDARNPTAGPEDPELPEIWNPCDGLSAVDVSESLGVDVTMDAGTPTAPQCTFVPAVEGDAVLDANYLVFESGLDAAWESMGISVGGDLSEPRVPGADDARMVVHVDEETFLVTGFVQNGDLIQIVNAVDPAPFDEQVVTGAVRSMMGELSARAPDAQTLS